MSLKVPLLPVKWSDVTKRPRERHVFTLIRSTHDANTVEDKGENTGVIVSDHPGLKSIYFSNPA